ncbi:MAG: tripartite tricarboxylate transporter permease [Desulfobacterales bacterium]|nr:tripartite tricarboxylate transporter permease [Desulfobacterales bacterium]
MIEALFQGLLDLLRFDVFIFMMLGVMIGLVFGIIPGLGGLTGLSILLSLVWGMQPVQALSFLLALSCATSQGGSITAILLNVPGTGPNAATLLDGYPMAQQGQAGRALGAVLAAGAFGGLFGGVLMIALIPVVRPLVLGFASPELFFLALLGISLITAIAKGSMAKGLISGALGIVLALFGYQMTTGIPRFTFGTLYLEDGIKLIPFTLGLFAFPEIIDLAVRRRAITRAEGAIAEVGSDLFEGVKDVFRHFWLFVRCSTIGTVLGIIPGVGAEVATFVCYGHAKQTSRHPERFGLGTVEGVIAPESAANAKEGGALLTTLAFGLPGSAVMALLLGAFLVVGITPGPKMLEENLALSFSLAWTNILANVLSSAILYISAKQLVKITFVNPRILAPFILVFATIGAYSVGQNILDVFAAFLFTLLGYGAKSFGYNRAALILGFILGDLAETYFLISLNAYGMGFPLRPVSLILIGIILLGMCFEPLMKLWRKAKV